jgi:hypothetical protein
LPEVAVIEADRWWRYVLAAVGGAAVAAIALFLLV